MQKKERVREKSAFYIYLFITLEQISNYIYPDAHSELAHREKEREKESAPLSRTVLRRLQLRLCRAMTYRVPYGARTRAHVRVSRT